MSATIDDARPFGEVVEEIAGPLGRLPDGEQLARMRNLLHDAVDANCWIAFAATNVDNSGSSDVTMALVGELAIHAKRIRESAAALLRDADQIDAKLDDLYVLAIGDKLEDDGE